LRCRLVSQDAQLPLPTFSRALSQPRKALIDQVAAPFRLQYPQGWLGQTLDGKVFEPLKGTWRTMPAFNDPAFW